MWIVWGTAEGMFGSRKEKGRSIFCILKSILRPKNGILQEKRYAKKPKSRKALKTILIIIAVFTVLLFAIYINHRIHLKKEANLLSPLGHLVEVDGHNMSIYIEGEGETTLVFMSGGGTCSPILDFKSLYSLLSDNCKIAVVENFGYGFSDYRPRHGCAAVL